MINNLHFLLVSPFRYKHLEANRRRKFSPEVLALMLKRVLYSEYIVSESGQCTLPQHASIFSCSPYEKLFSYVDESVFVRCIQLWFLVSLANFIDLVRDDQSLAEYTENQFAVSFFLVFSCPQNSQ
jgi:hypothetical protein